MYISLLCMNFSFAECTFTFSLHVKWLKIFILGDTEKNEKIAFVLLVKLLTKRTVNKPLIYIYEECLVCNIVSNCSIIISKTFGSKYLGLIPSYSCSKQMIQLKLQADHQLDLHQDLFYFRVKSHSILCSLKVKFFAYVIHFLMHLWYGLCHIMFLIWSTRLRSEKWHYLCKSIFLACLQPLV